MIVLTERVARAVGYYHTYYRASEDLENQGKESMASYFGRRDFGDPRHNFGRPVPPLSIPAQFPGQTSWPSLREGSEIVAPGIVEGHNGGAKNLGSNARRRPGSARKPSEKQPSSARLLTTIAAADASQNASSRQQSHAPSLSLQQPSRHISSFQRNYVASNGRESPGRQLTHASNGFTPRSQLSHSAGVDELMKHGFPRAVAEKAFRKLSGQADVHTTPRNHHHLTQNLPSESDAAESEYDEEVRSSK
jgi:hypothetical protein